jgi:hypothetical protein
MSDCSGCGCEIGDGFSNGQCVSCAGRDHRDRQADEIKSLRASNAALLAENEALKKEKLEWQLEPLKIRALEDQVRSITEKIYSSEDFADALALSKPGRLLPIDDEGRLSPQGITVLVHSLCALVARESQWKTRFDYLEAKIEEGQRHLDGVLKDKYAELAAMQSQLKRYTSWQPSDPGTKEALECAGSSWEYKSEDIARIAVSLGVLSTSYRAAMVRLEEAEKKVKHLEHNAKARDTHIERLTSNLRRVSDSLNRMVMEKRNGN